MMQLSYTRPKWLPTGQQGQTSPVPSYQQESRRRLWLCPHESIDISEAQELLDSEHPRKRCERATCQNTFIQMFTTKKRSTSGSQRLQLITSVDLFDIPCQDLPEEAINLWCSMDRIATVLGGLDLPICPHLNLSSPYLLSHLDLNSIPTLPENKFVNKCHCGTRPSLCEDASHCSTCFHDYQGVKTAFYLQANKVIREGRRRGQATIRLNIRLNIVRNLGALLHHLDPAWLTHSFTPLQLHQAAAVWNAWDADFSRLWHLRRSWAEDLIPVHQQIEGEILGREDPGMLSQLLRRDYHHSRECSGRGLRNTLSELCRDYQTRRGLRQAARESFRELAAHPDPKTFFRDSLRKFGGCETMKVVWKLQKGFWSRVFEEGHRKKWDETTEEEGSEDGKDEEGALLARGSARDRGRGRERRGTPYPCPTTQDGAAGGGVGDDAFEEALRLLRWRNDVERRARRERWEAREGRAPTHDEMYP